MIIKQHIKISTLHNRPRTLHIYLPSHLPKNNRLSVIYMFDGHNLFDDEEATYGTCWGLKEYFDAKKYPVMIVGIECNHEGNKRLEEFSPYSFDDPDYGEINAEGKEIMEWIVKDLKPYIDGIDYTGIAFKSDEAFSNDIIQIDQNDDKLTLIINQNLLSRIGIELDTLDDSDEGIALLESLGLDLKLQIKMPGTIISANYGDSFMQTVTLDLVDNIDSAFIVVSYVDNHVFYTFLAVAALIFAAILTLFYILYQASKRKKKTA